MKQRATKHRIMKCIAAAFSRITWSYYTWHLFLSLTHTNTYVECSIHKVWSCTHYITYVSWKISLTYFSCSHISLCHGVNSSNFIILVLVFPTPRSPPGSPYLVLTFPHPQPSPSPNGGEMNLSFPLKWSCLNQRKVRKYKASEA